MLCFTAVKNIPVSILGSYGRRKKQPHRRGRNKMGAIVNHCEIQIWQKFLMVWSEREASMVCPEFFVSVAPTAKDNQTSTGL